jgi:hypothetical protein
MPERPPGIPDDPIGHIVDALFVLGEMMARPGAEIVFSTDFLRDMVGPNLRRLSQALAFWDARREWRQGHTPSDLREILELDYPRRLGLTLEELAEREGVGRDAIHKRFTRARQEGIIEREQGG